MLPAVGRSVVFFHSRFKSQDEQLDRQSEVRTLSSWYRLWHSILLTSTCVGPNCRCTKRTISNCAAGCYHAIDTPGTHPVSFCVHLCCQGKTRRFASVLQRRAFTNRTNWSTWHVASYDLLTSRGSCAHALVKLSPLGGLNSTELTDLSPWLASISLSDRTASCRKRITIRD